MDCRNKLTSHNILRISFLAAVCVLPFEEIAATALFVVAVAAAVACSVKKKMFPVKKPAALLLLAFCAQAVVSLRGAPDFGYAALLCLFTLVRYVLVAYAAATFVRLFGWRELMYGIAVTAVLSALYGYCQILFMPAVENKEWIDAEKFGVITWRIYGTWSNPNIFGGYILFALSAATFIARDSAGKSWIRGAAFLAIAFFIVTIIMTFSRGVWIALFVMLIANGFVFLGKRIWLLLLPVFTIFAATGVLWQRLQSVFLANDSSSVMRLALWKSSEKMIFSHPWFGWGWGLYWFYYPQFDYLLQTAGLKVYHAHNTFLHLAVEAGIPEAVFFLAILFLAIYYSFSNKKNEPATASVLAALITAFSVLLVTDHVLYNPRMSMLFWLFVGGMFCKGEIVHENQTE